MIVCRSMLPFDVENLDAVRGAFAAATPMPMRQAWRDAPEPAFAPAVVRTGWQRESLLVFAELIDADVTTRATDHNQRFWELGDTFEMFLRAATDHAYVEFHVAPNNLRLSLRFPDAEWLARTPLEQAFTGALQSPALFESRTWRVSGGWCVLAEVPAASVCAHAALLLDTSWVFSFSRYDYTGGVSAPVISSTSPHALPRFHRQHEWGTLSFRG